MLCLLDKAPHEAVGILGDALIKSIFVGPLQLGRFWDGFLNEPGYEMLTALPDFPNDIGRLSLIPLRVHMDEGKWTGSAKNRVIMVCSISGMAHTPHPFESRLLFAVMPSSLYHKTGKRNPSNQTLEHLWRFAVWSLAFMWMNLWPVMPFPGSEFTKAGFQNAGRVLTAYRFLVIAIKGDLKMMKDPILRLSNHTLLECHWVLVATRSFAQKCSFHHFH